MKRLDKRSQIEELQKRRNKGLSSAEKGENESVQRSVNGEKTGLSYFGRSNGAQWA